MSDADLQAFAAEYHEEVRTHAAEGNEAGSTADAFTQLVIDDLIEAEILADGQVCRHEDRGIALNGYNLEAESLDLFVTRYTGSAPPASLDKKAVSDCFRPLAAFVKKVLKKYYASAEISPGTPIFDMSLTVYRARERLKLIRLFLLTDCRVSVSPPKEAILEGIKITYHIWDIQELFRYRCSGRRSDPIEFDFETTPTGPVPCIVLPDHGQQYRSFLAILPGSVLFRLYEEFGPRLLELNVRSFLQARGSVNRGILETIRKEQENFFAFNNGISATASTIETMTLPRGGLAIRRVSGLQIVNGGQTTASIHHAVRHHKADVSRLSVQAKFSEVPEGLLDTLVPRISEFANSQNKVSKDDFYANHVFHIEIEQLSRSILTVPIMVGGKPRMTHWFYERARGQYAEAARAASGSAASRRKFAEENPPEQRFGKTDLAKFINTWDGYPHWVSLGAQKNFLRFSERLRESPDAFKADSQHFHRLVALAILFRQTEKLVRERAFPAYRANIVTYSLAYLAHWRKDAIDLDRIWRELAVPADIVASLGLIGDSIQPIIDRADGGNVTEWCKKASCWEAIRGQRIKMDPPPPPDDSPQPEAGAEGAADRLPFPEPDAHPVAPPR